jgi:cyanophycin synthetase
VGVTLDLADKEGVLAAYDWACQASQTTEIMVEQFIHGVHHRLLVVGEDLVAASVARREYVYGDGVSTVRQLVEAVNRDPRRGENYTDRLEVVILNKSAALVLRKQGLDFDAVPEKDQQVLIDHVGDLVEDCTDAVHPQTRAQAVLAAKTVGLNIAGMDVVATDIGQPLVEQRGCFIEVNAGPSLTSHISPLIGKPRPVGEAILHQIFPTNSQSKVPLILVAHDERSPHDQAVPLSKILAQKLGEVGFHVGIATIDPRPSEGWPLYRPLSQFRSLLLHPTVSAIVVEGTQSQFAFDGVPCTHAEYVVLEIDRLVDTFFAKTIKHLSVQLYPTPARSAQSSLPTMERSAQILCLGRGLDATEVAFKCGIPESRVKVIADRTVLLEYLAEQFRQTKNPSKAGV